MNLRPSIFCAIEIGEFFRKWRARPTFALRHISDRVLDRLARFNLVGCAGGQTIYWVCFVGKVAGTHGSNPLPVSIHARQIAGAALQVGPGIRGSVGVAALDAAPG